MFDVDAARVEAAIEAVPDDARMDPESRLAIETEKAVLRLQAQKAARKIVAAEAFAPFSFPDDFEYEMEEPDPEVWWTLEGLHTKGANSIIIAGFKTGKTTMMHNLIRSLVDGEPFLGEHAVRKIDGRVLYLNFEVEASLAKRDLRKFGFKRPKRFTHWPLRGRTFDVMDDSVADWFVTELKRLEIEVLIVDPFSGAYHGEENSNSEQTAFTKRLDEIKFRAEVTDLFMPVHTGRGEADHGAERARGGTKLDDWADHRWILTKLRDSNVRYFRAEGRGGMEFEKERALEWDAATGALAYNRLVTGTRKSATDDRIREDVLTHIRSHAGCSGRNITDNVEGDDGAIRKIIKRLVAERKIHTKAGPKNSTLHFIGSGITGLEDI